MNKEIIEQHCSFCGRPKSAVAYLLQGVDGCICDECLHHGDRVLEENKVEANENSMKGIPKPKEIKEFLDQYVIGQDNAKERISVAVYNHYKRINMQKHANSDVEIAKSNLLLVGPTGSGKTYLAQTVAKLLNVPFCIVDSTVLTEAGYVGEDVESILTRLLQASDYDVEKAERGIIFIDEIDKIARKSDNPSITRDVSGEGVQQALLKLLEGSVVLCPPNGGRKHPDQKMIPVNTKNILFICGGAFDGIEKKIAKRFNKQTVGFKGILDREKNNLNVEEINLMERVTPQDLKSFGLIPELIGRIPCITTLDPLNKEALLKILTEPKNALVKQYELLFDLDNIKLTFDKEVFEYIVDKALENKIGARGLRGIMEDIMTRAMFDMPSEDVKEFNVTLKYAKERLKDTEDKEESDNDKAA